MFTGPPMRIALGRSVAILSEPSAMVLGSWRCWLNREPIEDEDSMCSEATPATGCARWCRTWTGFSIAPLQDRTTTFQQNR
jgi:hypothetical protein